MGKCDTCKFWARSGFVDTVIGPARHGKCHRNAPKDRGVNNAFWPETHETNWCGEYQGEPEHGDQG